MKLSKMLVVAIFALIVSPFGGTGSYLAVAAQDKAPALVNSDCGKCHLDVPRDIEEAGQAHKTSVSCQDCHEGHPPIALEVIPACSQCHSGSLHYQIEGCLSCHTNPHRPLEITLGKGLTAPCLTCHADPGVQLQEFPSKHTVLACTSCHENKHGNIPNCTNCHKPHSATMVEVDCHKCHQPHKPLAVTYPSNTPSVDCGACHDQVFNVLTTSLAKHSKLSCANCHENKHKNIPQCTQCHQPHVPEMTADKCTLCHPAHNPAPVVYGDQVASANCGACHDGIFKTLDTSKTKHKSLNCVDCHAATHGNTPQCVECHEPHAKEMVQADCVSCHDAHNPLPVVYTEKLPSTLCAACHTEAFNLLQANTTKHRDLKCSACHQEKHKMIPVCQDCHGVAPHSPRMLEKFPGCGACHNIAHDLTK